MYCSNLYFILHKDFLEEAEKEKKELEESYKDARKQQKERDEKEKERKKFRAKAIDGYGE